MEVLQKDRNAYHKVTICNIKSLYLDCIFFLPWSIFISLFTNKSFLYLNVYDECNYFLLQLSDKYDNLEREFNILKVRVQHFLTYNLVQFYKVKSRNARTHLFHFDQAFKIVFVFLPRNPSIPQKTSCMMLGLRLWS